MRIGINVPDELLRQVKAIRPSVSVSQVCRQALERYVEIAEMARSQAIADQVDREVERLTHSLKAPIIEPDWVAYALEDARDWVRGVTAEVWERFIYQIDFLRRQGRDEAEMVDIWSDVGDGRGLQHRMTASASWFEYQFDLQFESGGGADPHDKAREEYSRAWLGYVHEARRKLENHYKVEYDRVMAERAEYRKSIPDPELPPQLVD